MAPPLAMTTPAFLTSGAKSAMYPPSLEVITPLFKIPPVEPVPLLLKTKLPPMKSESLICAVVAKKLPVSTLALGEKYTPLGFSKKTDPLELILP